jgi:peptide/nickel transport system permease protein
VIQYIFKRLLLFFPTLVLVSCLTFFLSKQVPADQVAIILSIQGIDDDDQNWQKEYNALQQKMDFHLPQFYFSIKPNYSIDTKDKEYDVYEKKFISRISDMKFSKEYIFKIVDLINQTSESTQRKLFNSTGLEQLKSKIISSQFDFPKDSKLNITQLIEEKSLHKIQWHYPIIKYNGIQNQYHRWVSKIFKGDFGFSLIDYRPITDKLWEAMKWSVLLVFLNLFFALLISFPIGMYNGIKPNSLFDKISNSILFAFFAVPKFWMATLFIIFFTSSEYGAWTNIFPSVGIWDLNNNEGFLSMVARSWYKLILPVLILVIPDSAYLARLIRSSVQEESKKEYIKTALSKGMSIKDITIKHILPNSLVPTISLLVGTLPGALASTLVIEVIFNIPGIGRLMYDSIQFADWAMVYPIVLIISVLAVVIFLLGDILMAYLNPKMKLG